MKNIKTIARELRIARMLSELAAAGVITEREALQWWTATVGVAS